MASFFSERTAEYSLVPHLMVELQKKYRLIAPIYFWRTREGNNIAHELHCGTRVKILSLFARRPKVTNDIHIVHGKINEGLIRYSRIAKEHGIPTIAGFIASNNIFNNFNPRNHLFFDLTTDLFETDYNFSYDIYDHKIIELEESISNISTNDIITITQKCCRSLTWKEATELIYQLNNTINRPGDMSYIFWRGGYKPIYFILSE